MTSVLLPAGVVIRAQRPDDAEALVDVHLRSWRWAYTGLIPDEYIDRLWASRSERIERTRHQIEEAAADDRFLLAERGGAVVGLAYTHTSADEGAEPSTAEVGALYLSPEAAGQGIGRALLDHAVDDLRARGFARATLWVLETNLRVRRFYETAGWRPDGAAKVEDRPGASLSEVRYVVDLMPAQTPGADLRPVLDYYAVAGQREWDRLEPGTPGSIEFAVTAAVLSRHLSPSASVLDLGGGPGRYAIWLAERGHRVILADVSSALLSQARAKLADRPDIRARAEIVEGDARDLSRWANAMVDAVVCLGPFYHLTAEADRSRALAEIARVLRPSGVLVAAVMPRLAFIRRTLALSDERHRLADPTWVSKVVNDGVFVNDIAGRFTGGYGFQVDEIVPFFESGGFETRELVAAESYVPGVESALADARLTDPAAYEAALDLAIRSAADPSILGMASHVLYVGERIGEDG